MTVTKEDGEARGGKGRDDGDFDGGEMSGDDHRPPVEPCPY